MTIQVVTLSVQDLQGIVADAYKEGYVKAQREWEAEKTTKKEEPKFNEILRGVKELNRYLAYKGYWVGSVNTLNKKTTQLRALGENQGRGLIFRKGEIDHAFETGFSFEPIAKKPLKQTKQEGA